MEMVAFDGHMELSRENGRVEVELQEFVSKDWHIELHRVTGRVFVETLLDFSIFEDFFFSSFLFSVLRVLISNLKFLMLSERFSFFCSILYVSFSFNLRALFARFSSFLRPASSLSCFFSAFLRLASC